MFNSCFCGFRSCEVSSYWIKSVLRESFVFFFAYFYRRLFRSCGFQEGRIADKASFSGKILPLYGCGDFPGNPCGLNLTFQDAGLPLPQDTYRTGRTGNTMRRFTVRISKRYGCTTRRCSPSIRNTTRKWFMAAYSQNKGMQRRIDGQRHRPSICLYAHVDILFVGDTL